ncbi:hypothetical protein [Corynebacterium sphenisci]|nr:hypothetical protein [Corynebacterium sphenisci]
MPSPARIRALICAAPLVPLGFALGAPDYVVGFWPLAMEQLRYLAGAAGICAAVAAAWNAAQVDHRYLGASAAGRARAVLALVEPAATMTLLLGGVGAAGVLLRLYRAPVGGAIPWWIVVSSVLWVVAAAAAGAAAGAWRYRQPALAGVIAFVGAVGLLVLANRPAGITWAPMALFGWTSSDNFVRYLPDTAALVGSWVIAGAIATWAVWSLLRRGGAAARVVTVVVAVPALVAVSAVTARGPADAGRLVPRPMPDAPECTAEAGGVRVCGWPEHRAQIAALDARWPEVAEYLRAIGVPMPEGLIAAEGLERVLPEEPVGVADYIATPDVATSYLVDDAVTRTLGEETVLGCTTADGPLYMGVLPAFGFVAQELYFPDAPAGNLGMPGQEAIIRWLAEHDEGEVVAGMRGLLADLADCGAGAAPETPW